MNWSVLRFVLAVCLAGNAVYTAVVLRDRSFVGLSWKTWTTYPVLAAMMLTALPVHLGCWIWLAVNNRQFPALGGGRHGNTVR
ncbi:MAG: hypothetical protein HYT39_04070 [Candidatus Sungbacteria bacterium]|nr:hypothetical protein [Candidatus Sungbacteria bacterium]